MLFKITLIIVCSCLVGFCFFTRHENYEKIADRLTEKIAEKLKEQKKLQLVGTGGKMMKDIQAMDMSFHFYQEVDLKTGRDLVVSAVDEYLNGINNNKELKPYLHEYPFTAKNVEILIWIYKSDGTSPSSDKIYYISAIDGIITYYVNEPETNSRKVICKETYDEALKAIH